MQVVIIMLSLFMFKNPKKVSPPAEGIRDSVLAETQIVNDTIAHHHNGGEDRINSTFELYTAVVFFIFLLLLLGILYLMLRIHSELQGTKDLFESFLKRMDMRKNADNFERRMAGYFESVEKEIHDINLKVDDLNKNILGVYRSVSGLSLKDVLDMQRNTLQLVSGILNRMEEIVRYQKQIITKHLKSEGRPSSIEKIYPVRREPVVNQTHISTESKRVSDVDIKKEVQRWKELSDSDKAKVENMAKNLGYSLVDPLKENKVFFADLTDDEKHYFKVERVSDERYAVYPKGRIIEVVMPAVIDGKGLIVQQGTLKIKD